LLPTTTLLKYVYTMTKQRGRPKKNTDVQNTPSLKQGDKVTCMTHPGVWELVWYKEGDTTCAIQNEKYRCIVKKIQNYKQKCNFIIKQLS
jgi:hypothetical protein